MKKLIFIFLASSTFAVLPPLAQSTREVQALLADGRFYDALGSAEQIKDIIRTDKGYLVLTENYAMRVDIKYGGGDKKIIGPLPFELQFYQPINLRGTDEPKRS
jgi:hypothetical protein